MQKGRRKMRPSRNHVVAALVLLGALTPVRRLDENENIEKESAVIFHLHLQTCMLPAKEALMEA